RLGVHGSTVGFVVCPTSWTEDEDFDVIIDAVVRLEHRIRGWEAASRDRRFPDLVVLVTGDGERRAEFERRFAGLPARRIQLRARWLEPDDYPRVVGSADLGLCLHRSSSGLDIPMKIADLFGAGVPNRSANRSARPRRTDRRSIRRGRACAGARLRRVSGG